LTFTVAVWSSRGLVDGALRRRRAVLGDLHRGRLVLRGPVDRRRSAARVGVDLDGQLRLAPCERVDLRLERLDALRVVLSDRDDKLRVEPAQSLINRLDRGVDVDRLNLDVDRAILLQLGQVAQRLGRVDPG
jgi:hypothetical protein